MKTRYRAGFVSSMLWVTMGWGFNGLANAQSSGLVQPEGLLYLGAFRLPDRDGNAEDRASWEYGGQALTYYSGGDPSGGGDGFPGSLFGTGHDVWNDVSEIGIPAPNTTREIGGLPVARTIQPFHDIRGGLFDPLNEIPRVGIEVLAQPGQSPGKLHVAWGQHFHDDEYTQIPSHAWCELDLSRSNIMGAWWIGNESLYSTNGYIFSIPDGWANQHTAGRVLATGRYRDGGWSGMGPSLFAYAPWLDGNPPPPGAHLTARTLLLYSNTRGEGTSNFKLTGYHHSDEWEGGAWLTTDDGRAAVVFVGTKGSGYHWYGFYSPAGDGLPCVEQGLTMIGCFTPEGNACGPEHTGYCEGNLAESRGWWSSRFDAQILFYDPAHLAAVAAGTMAPHEPQPYAVLDIDEQLFLNATVEQSQLGYGDQRKHRIGEIAYDRERGHLYVIERFADEAKPVIHVWVVQ